MAATLELDWLVTYSMITCDARQFVKTARVIAALGMALSIAGCEGRPVVPSAQAEAGLRATPASSPAAPHAAAEPTTTASDFTTTGPLVVDQQTDVLAERDGRVVEIGVEIADHVHKGQLLARLDDRELEAARAAKAGKVDSLKAQIREWEAEQQGNEADLRRADLMRTDKIISEEDWEHVKYKLQQTIAEVARYKADESSAEYELHAMDVQLEQSRITAPFAGVVGRRSIRVAQEVKKGDALFWITAERPLHILFSIPEAAMGAFHPGTRLELTTAIYPGLQQPATVRRVSPVVDPASGSLEVIGDLERPSNLLRPGMSMQVRLRLP